MALPWLGVDWVESGALAREPSSRRGSGSELTEVSIPYELGGVRRATITPEGAHCHLEFALKFVESILETDAPVPTTTYGGSLDMTGAPDLTGQRVLIVEDDHCAASDAAAAFRGPGAEVLGPCPSEESTAMLLEQESTTAAVIDLNLGGGGPRFEVAKMLKERGVPFIFLSGYDPDVVPPELMDVLRLQKPLPLFEVVEAVGRLQPA